MSGFWIGRERGAAPAGERGEVDPVRMVLRAGRRRPRRGRADRDHVGGGARRRHRVGRVARVPRGGHDDLAARHRVVRRDAERVGAVGGELRAEAHRDHVDLGGVGAPFDRIDDARLAAGSLRVEDLADPQVGRGGDAAEAGGARAADAVAHRDRRDVRPVPVVVERRRGAPHEVLPDDALRVELLVVRIGAGVEDADGHARAGHAEIRAGGVDAVVGPRGIHRCPDDRVVVDADDAGLGRETADLRGGQPGGEAADDPEPPAHGERAGDPMRSRDGQRAIRGHDDGLPAAVIGPAARRRSSTSSRRSPSVSVRRGAAEGSCAIGSRLPAGAAGTATARTPAG